MKYKLFTLSLSLLALSSTIMRSESANNSIETLQAKKNASAPSSSKQAPFEKLEQQDIALDTQEEQEDIQEQETPDIQEETSTPTATPDAAQNSTIERDPFEQADQSFASIIKSIQDEMNNLHDIVRTVQENSVTSCTSCASSGHHKDISSRATRVNKITPDVKSIDEKYYIKENVTKDVNNQNLLEITIGVPGYMQDDITVKFHQIKRKDKSGKTLEIYAKKQVSQEEAQDETRKEKSQKKQARVNTKTSHQFMSTTNINGKNRELFYKDGVLKIMLDLPHDVSSDYYTMSLENDELRICLPKSSDTQETKVLKFK